MIKQVYTDWLKTHVEEVFTAVLTAFFTALMFRVGLGMLFSIVVGLALAYLVRLVLLRKVVEALSARIAGLRGADPETDDNPRT